MPADRRREPIDPSRDGSEGKPAVGVRPRDALLPVELVVELDLGIGDRLSGFIGEPASEGAAGIAGPLRPVAFGPLPGSLFRFRRWRGDGGLSGPCGSAEPESGRDHSRHERRRPPGGERIRRDRRLQGDEPPPVVARQAGAELALTGLDHAGDLTRRELREVVHGLVALQAMTSAPVAVHRLPGAGARRCNLKALQLVFPRRHGGSSHGGVVASALPSMGLDTARRRFVPALPPCETGQSTIHASVESEGDAERRNLFCLLEWTVRRLRWSEK